MKKKNKNYFDLTNLKVCISQSGDTGVMGVAPLRYKLELWTGNYPEDVFVVIVADSWFELIKKLFKWLESEDR